jgi:hypothetical protein
MVAGSEIGDDQGILRAYDRFGSGKLVGGHLDVKLDIVLRSQPI